MSKIQDRENIILEALQHRKKLSIEEVTEMLGISLSSARRLFIQLENTGKYVRTHGGIHLVSNKSQEYSFEALESKNIAEKQQIARCAAEIIANDDIVYFDSGTTLQQLAIALKERLQAKALQRVRVITNSFANLIILQDSCYVILIGGEYHPERRSFSGYPAERFVRNFTYTKAFLGVDSLDLNEGFMTIDTDTAKLNEVVMKRTDENYVLLDSSKFETHSFVSYAAISEVKAIITDNSIADATKAQCAQANLNVIVAR